MIEKKYISPILNKIRNDNFESDLKLAHNLSVDYINKVDNMRVYPDEQSIRNLSIFDEDLSDEPENTRDILNKLDKYGSPATVAQTGGRYFGFVNGGIFPSALCSKRLTDAWDQNAALYVISPVASKIEDVCERWLKNLLKLPEATVAGFVSGSSTATLCGLVAGRNYLLSKMDYDVTKDGLFNAPQVKVIVGDGAHSTIYKALSIIGLGNERITKVPSDDQGRIVADNIPELDDKTLLILQAGNVNSGAFDDFSTIC